MRALGMGGAFVAVADDASATYWNPARAGHRVGLLGGRRVDRRRSRHAADLAAPAPARVRAAAAGHLGGASAPGRSVPPSTGCRPPRPRVSTAGDPAAVAWRALRAPHHDARRRQRAADHRSRLHVGATLKYVHGSRRRQAGDAGARRPARRRGRPRDRGSNRFDIDAGVMADLRTVKLGLTVRNLFEPEFDTTDEGRGSSCRARSAPASPFRATDTLIVSLDADLTRSPRRHRRAAVAGRRRRAAFLAGPRRRPRRLPGQHDRRDPPVRHDRRQRQPAQRHLRRRLRRRRARRGRSDGSASGCVSSSDASTMRHLP